VSGDNTVLKKAQLPADVLPGVQP